MNLDDMTEEDLHKAIALLKAHNDTKKYNKINYFKPYGWQSEYINASKENKQLLAMTGNRCGKTYTGAFIMACHLTGLYPDWWEGCRFDRPIMAWAAGISTVTTRDQNIYHIPGLKYQLQLWKRQIKNA